MTPLEFSLAGWSCWSRELPGAEAAEAWYRRGETVASQEQPACADVPPMLRRRCSLLTRMVLETGAAALRSAGLSPDRVGKVFASRHGEIQTLSGLFGDLADGSPLSPTAFSTSVHHSAAGYLGIVYGNRFPSRAVSAGDRSLAAGLLEAFGMIRRHGVPVLLVFADESFPERFLGLTSGLEHAKPAALALVIDVADSPNAAGRPRLSYHEQGAPAPLLADDLLRWLAASNPPRLQAEFWNGTLAWAK
jgi:hypothetical protein